MGVNLFNGGQVGELFWLANAPSVTRARRTRPEMGASTRVYSRFRRACSREAAAAAYSALARSSSRPGLLMLTYADGALGDQGGIPGGLVLRIRQNGPGTSHCSLAFIQDSLKRSRVYFKKKIARPDRLPFLIAAFLNNSRHAAHTSAWRYASIRPGRLAVTGT